MTDNENHDDERRNRIKEFKQNQIFFLNEEKHFVSTYTKRKFCYGQIKPRPENAPYGGIIVTFQIIPCLEKGEDEPKVPFTQGTPVSISLGTIGSDKAHYGVVILVRYTADKVSLIFFP